MSLITRVLRPLSVAPARNMTDDSFGVAVSREHAVLGPPATELASSPGDDHRATSA